MADVEKLQNKQSKDIPPDGYQIIKDGKVGHEDMLLNDPIHCWEPAADSPVAIGDDVDGYFAVARLI